MPKIDEDEIFKAAHALQRQIGEAMRHALGSTPVVDVAEIMSEHHKWGVEEAYHFLNGTSRDDYYDVESIAKMALLSGKTARIIFE